MNGICLNPYYSPVGFAGGPPPAWYQSDLQKRGLSSCGNDMSDLNAIQAFDAQQAAGKKLNAVG